MGGVAPPMPREPRRLGGVCQRISRDPRSERTSAEALIRRRLETRARPRTWSPKQELRAQKQTSGCSFGYRQSAPASSCAGPRIGLQAQGFRRVALEGAGQVRGSDSRFQSLPVGLGREARPPLLGEVLHHPCHPKVQGDPGAPASCARQTKRDCAMGAVYLEQRQRTCVGTCAWVWLRGFVAMWLLGYLGTWVCGCVGGLGR